MQLAYNAFLKETEKTWEEKNRKERKKENRKIGKILSRVYGSVTILTSSGLDDWIY
jgi:hypothetical protein